MPSDSALRGAPEPDDVTWEQERDARLTAFVAARLTEVAATGCSAEQALAAGVRDVFWEWNLKRELASKTNLGLFEIQIGALGWVLRCVVHRAWHRAPDYEVEFHPQAVNPETAMELSV